MAAYRIWHHGEIELYTALEQLKSEFVLTVLGTLSGV